MFIADYIEEEDTEIVYRYGILWDFNVTNDPVIYLNRTSKIIQYQGGNISGMCAVDDDDYLFIADKTEGKMVRIDHSDELWNSYNVYRGNE